MFPMETITIQNIKHVFEMQLWQLLLLNPNLFKHHHVHNSPGELPPKMPTLQTVFRTELQQIYRSSAVKQIQTFLHNLQSHYK